MKLVIADGLLKLSPACGVVWCGVVWCGVVPWCGALVWGPGWGGGPGVLTDGVLERFGANKKIRICFTDRRMQVFRDIDISYEWLFQCLSALVC